ncbi:MAG: YkgJ family cysteine cluster protein [Pseudomonadota bacterium]
MRKPKSGSRSSPQTPEDLARRLPGIRLKGVAAPVLERARRLLAVTLETASAHNLSYRDVVRDLAYGTAALRVGEAEIARQSSDPNGPLRTAACASGCAFCCILAGEDGGTIIEAEARRLHAALGPSIGAPPASAWHAKACAALDPETRTCRAYDARPMICRSHISSDAGACEKVAAGTPAPGPGVLSGHFTYLAVMSLGRALLKGVAKAPTYALAEVTRSAMAGEDLATTLETARHKPRALDDEVARMSATWGKAWRAG